MGIRRPANVKPSKLSGSYEYSFYNLLYTVSCTFMLYALFSIHEIFLFHNKKSLFKALNYLLIRKKKYQTISTMTSNSLTHQR